MPHETIKAGDTISFVTHSSIDAEVLTGVVEYKDQLGLIVFVDGVQYELRKLLNIKIIYSMQKHFAVSVFTDTCNKGVQCHVRLFPTMQSGINYFNQTVKEMEGWIVESEGSVPDDVMENGGCFHYDDNDGTTYVVKLTDIDGADVIDIFS